MEYTHPYELISSTEDYIEMFGHEPKLMSDITEDTEPTLCPKCGTALEQEYEMDTDAVLGLKCENCGWEKKY